MSTLNRKPLQTDQISNGPYIAKVISHLDPSYMGSLEVQLMREVGGDPNREGQIYTVQYMSPFYGVTSIDHVTDSPDYNNTQKSYGMWMVPPDIGTKVIVIFTEGPPRIGFWIGCVQDKNMNFMVPGYASTKYAVEKQTDKERVPVAEYNKKIQTTVQDVTKYDKPASPFETVLDQQGLLEDDVRGITTSSARREVPSMVFGISTPGPIDKQGGAKQGDVGKYEHKVKGAFVSRLGGSSFVMDDGDDKFIRKKKPWEGPMEYSAVEQGETDGEVTIPHNEMIRLRTRTGHQFLMHNSEDLIYISNSRGTSWVQLSSDGKIDIFAEDSINIHSKQDLNITADRDLNIEVGRNFNLKVKEEMHTHVYKDNILIVDGNQLRYTDKNIRETVRQNTFFTSTEGSVDVNVKEHIFHTSGNTNETKAGGNIIETAPEIHMNGPTAATATKAEIPFPLQTHTVPDEEGAELVKSIMRRVPTHEPFPHHENLDPELYKPEKTDRDVDGRYSDKTADVTAQDHPGIKNSETIKDPASTWKKYSTTTDTFEKIGPAEEG